MGMEQPVRDLGPLKPEDLQRFRWEELKIRVDTYKYYVDLTLKANAFFYATTGVILGFYLKEPDKPQATNLDFILFLPILLGAVLGGIFIFTAFLQTQNAKSIKKILAEFNHSRLSIEKIPDLNLLLILLVLSAVIFSLVSFVLIFVPLIGKSLPRVGNADYFVRAISLWVIGLGGTCLLAWLIEKLSKEKTKSTHETTTAEPPNNSNQSGQSPDIKPAAN